MKAILKAEDMGGLNVGLLVDIPGRMSEGNWKVVAYVDESANDAAYDGLLQILSGTAGGTTGLFTMLLVGEIIGAERERVEIELDGTTRRIKVGRKNQGEIEMITGADPSQPVVMTNTQYWMGANVITARGVKSRVRHYGRVWDFDRKSAEIGSIN